MVKPRVLIVGATGRTGSVIVAALLEAGETQVEALVRPASSKKPLVLQLKERNVKIHIAEIKDEVQLASILAGVDTIICTLAPDALFEQIPLANAAKKAGVKRFVPCAFMTVCSPGGVMWIRDQRQEIYQHIFKLGLTYTVIDVGRWCQAFFPTLPSGRVDYASLLVPFTTIFGDGDLKTGSTDIRDIGKYVARIIGDKRTVNRYVCCFGEMASQEEEFGMMEGLAGERIARRYIPAEELLTLLEETRASFKYDFSDMLQAFRLVGLEYAYSKFGRGDNCPEYAKYLGYLDAKDLYPDFVPRSIGAYLKELLDGKAVNMYEGFTLRNFPYQEDQG